MYDQFFFLSINLHHLLNGYLTITWTTSVLSAFPWEMLNCFITYCSFTIVLLTFLSYLFNNQATIFIIFNNPIKIQFCYNWRSIGYARILETVFWTNIVYILALLLSNWTNMILYCDHSKFIFYRLTITVCLISCNQLFMFTWYTVTHWMFENNYDFRFIVCSGLFVYKPVVWKWR